MYQNTTGDKKDKGYYVAPAPWWLYLLDFLVTVAMIYGAVQLFFFLKDFDLEDYGLVYEPREDIGRTITETSASGTVSNKVVSESSSNTDKWSRSDELNYEGWNQYLNGDSKKAETYFLAAIELDSMNEHALNNMGLIKTEEGAFEDAIDYFEKSIVANPGRGKVYHNIGVVHVKQGDYATAKSWYLKAIEAQSTWTGSHEALGTIYIEEGEIERGLAYLQAAMFTNSSRYAEIQRTIRYWTDQGYSIGPLE